MASFTLILSEIMTHTSAQFAGWRIGITQDLAERSAYQGLSHSFQSWEVDTLELAQKIKNFAVDLGMTDCTATEPLPSKQTYVYILKN